MTDSFTAFNQTPNKPRAVHIDSLKIFRDLVQTGSFSETAKRHQVTQSAISQQIRSAEKRLGAQLVERTNQGVRLTPEGQVFLEACEQISPLFDQAVQRIARLHGQIKGTLKIATVLTIGLHELPPHVKRFREQFQEAVLEVNYRKASQVYSEVLDGVADLGLVAFPKLRRGLAVQVYAKDRLGVICAPSHPLAQRRYLKLSDLNGLDFVAFEPDAPTRQALDRIMRIERVAVNRTMEFDNIETVKRAVEIESGISIVPLRSVAREVERGTLMAVEIRGPATGIWRPLGIIRRRNKAVTPPMRAFIDLILAGEREATKSVAKSSQGGPPSS